MQEVKQRRVRPTYTYIKEETVGDGTSADNKKEKPEKVAPQKVAVAKTEEKPVETAKPKTARPNGLYAGIPATPVHKKSKFQKPVTKMIAKETDGAEREKKAVKEEKPEKRVKPAKWKVTEKDGSFSATLVSPSGEKLVTTADYSALSGLKNAVASVKNNLLANNAEIEETNGKFVIKILSANGKNLLSDEGYPSKYRCEKAVYNSKMCAADAIFEQ